MSTIVDVSDFKIIFFTWFISFSLTPHRSGTGIWADRQYAIDQCEKRPEHCFFPKERYSRDTGLPHKDFVEVMRCARLF